LLAIELARAEVDGSGGGSLNELVRERLGRFSTTGVEVLEWAAVLLPPIDAVSLSVVAGLDATEIGEVLEVAERQAMLVPADNGLRYSHDLIAKAVYADISPLRRQVMHRRAAEILEQESALDLARASWLAHHSTLSGDPGLAARSMVSVGKLCLRFFANDNARSLARQGLQFAKELSDPARVAVEIDLHNILLSAEPIDDWETAAELYAALAERALDLGDLPHARLGYHMAAYVRWSQGEWDGAREQSLQSSRVMRGDDSKANIVGMAETAKCLVMLERDLSQADAMLMEADSLAQRRQFAHPAIAAGNGMLRLHENRLDEAEEFFQQSRTLCKSAGDRLNEFLASEYLVIIELQRGRYEVARDRAKQLVSLGEKIREGSEKPFADALLGLCNYAIDDDFAELDAALDALRIADAKYRLAYILTRTAVIDCERGRKQNAVERATEALEYATILERPTEMLIANAVLACGFGEMDAEEAAGHAGEVDRLLPAAASWAADIGRRLAAGRECKKS
jgi:tetratricopeptide (TPR) repeat protein